MPDGTLPFPLRDWRPARAAIDSDRASMIKPPFKPTALFLAVLAIACLLLAGCASTTVYEDGKPVMKTTADASNIKINTGRTSLSADTLNHSTPTKAQGTATSAVIRGLGSAAGEGAKAFAK